MSYQFIIVKTKKSRAFINCEVVASSKKPNDCSSLWLSVLQHDNNVPNNNDDEQKIYKHE